MKRAELARASNLMTIRGVGAVKVRMHDETKVGTLSLFRLVDPKCDDDEDAAPTAMESEIDEDASRLESEVDEDLESEKIDDDGNRLDSDGMMMIERAQQRPRAGGRRHQRQWLSVLRVRHVGVAQRVAALPLPEARRTAALSSC